MLVPSFVLAGAPSILILNSKTDKNVQSEIAAAIPGLRSRVIANYGETVQAIEFSKPDVILIATARDGKDGVTGEEIADKLRRKYRDIPVIYTGTVESEKELGDRYKGVHYLKKPYKAADLAALILKLYGPNRSLAATAQ